MYRHRARARPLRGSLRAVDVWQLADSGTNDLIFICVLPKPTALAFALRLDQLQQSHCRLLSSNKGLGKLVKLTVADCSFSQGDLEGSARGVLALEGELR